MVLISICYSAFGQSSSHQYVTVVAEPDHADWTYHVGEKVNITAYAIRENVRMKDCEITYSYGPGATVWRTSVCRRPRNLDSPVCASRCHWTAAPTRR